jgi:SHS family lactate transporter-like MFS transporter
MNGVDRLATALENAGVKRRFAWIAASEEALLMRPCGTQTDPAVARSATRAAGAAGSWTPAQRSAVIASFLAWVFDAFDFVLMVFVLNEVAADFGTPITCVTFAIVVTLTTRPIGAFVFGRVADRYGRRPTLVVVIVLYPVLELLSAFSPNLVFLICVRALFGIAMEGV